MSTTHLQSAAGQDLEKWVMCVGAAVSGNVAEDGRMGGWRRRAGRWSLMAGTVVACEGGVWVVCSLWHC